MMHYEKKFAKYSKKITNLNKLLSNAQFGGKKNDKKKDKIETSKEFFERSKGTVIEEQYDILFNMLLVKKNARSAYLLEVINTGLNGNEILTLLKKKYDEFTYTIEYELDNEPYRIFVHINPLIEFENDYDKWIGINLGFKCELSNSYENKKMVSYGLLLPNISHDNPIWFYTETCPFDDFDEDFFNDRSVKFDEIANEIGGEVVIYIENHMSPNYYLDLLLTDKLTEKDGSDIFNMCDGGSVTNLWDGFSKKYYDINDMIHDKKILAFKLLELQNNPLAIFWPVPREITNELRQTQAEIFNVIGGNPIDMYEKFEQSDIAQQIMQNDNDVANKMKIYFEIKEKLFEEYRKLDL